VRQAYALSAAVTIVVAVAALVATTGAGCGGRPPPPARGIIEGDVGGWHFRRYQELLDVEVWVPGNRAVAYTASYVRDEAEKRGRIGDRDVANAVVTRYDQETGVARAVAKFARRLAQESGYQVEESSVEGVHLVIVKGGDETWALWAARRHVVKIGGRGIASLPDGLIDAYGERYPSILTGDVLEGPLPPGVDEPKPKEGEEPYDPNNPTPDWDRYEPKKTQAPARKPPPDEEESDE
jgi:hypothetical protein